MRNLRRRLLWLVLGAILLFTAITTFSHTYSAAETVPPKVIDTAPVRGEELQIGTTSVTFYFDRSMNRGSVESAFGVKPAIRGSFQWKNDSTVIFQPAQPWQRATSYMFTIAKTATSTAGVAIDDTFTLRLNTTSSLEVSQVLPEDGTKNIEEAPLITVVFNRPVVPLVPASGMAKLPSPISLVPPAEGDGQWLNTSIYTFRPRLLQGGTVYVVTVNKGLTDVTGSVLTNDVSFSFSTVEPKAIEVQPNNNATGLIRDPAIKVTFSQPMDTVATEAAFSLTDKDGVKVPGKFTWDDKFYSLTFQPNALLDYEAVYKIYVDRTTARSKTNGLIAKEVKAQFTTISAPDILSTTPTDGETAEADGSFVIYFTAPMRLENFKDRISISPLPENLHFATDADPRGLSYRLSFGADPSTNYIVTLDLFSLTDRYGTPIKLNPANKMYRIVGPSKVQIRYATAAYPPSASLKTGTNIGMYSAYRPVTRVYTMHRNINSVTLALWSLPLQDFLRFSGANAFQYRGGYEPGNSNYLRRWTVPVYNPTNTMRYDLLSISAHGTSVGQKDNLLCTGAPPARLDIGQRTAVLKNDGSAFRLRDKAGMDSVIIGQVQPGIEFNIVDGPLCADKFVWWKLQSADGTVSGWGAEGDATKYFIGPIVDQPQTTEPNGQSTVQTADESNQSGGHLKTGVYWLDFTSSDLPDSSRKLSHLMLVATANITLKVTPRQALVWVTDLQSGEPVADVNVQLYTGREANTLGKPIKTDAQGLARFTLLDVQNIMYDGVYAVVDDGGNFGVGASSWSTGIEPGDFDQQSEFQPSPYSVYLYTDRTLYRPGQTVYYRGVLRDRDDSVYTISKQKKVTVEIYDGHHSQISRKELTVNSFGTFTESFDINDKAALGDWQIVVRPNAIDSQDNAATFMHQFSVADYRLPEFQVKVAADESQVVQGGKIRVKIDSSYFFGGPVSNAKINWAVRANQYYFSAPGLSGFSFTDFNEDEGYQGNSTDYDHNVAEGVDKTDDKGQFTISLPAALNKSKQSQIYTIEAGVTDETHQQVAGAVQVIIHQGEFYIGATAAEYVGTAGQPQAINLVSVGWDGKPSPKQALSLRVVERVWTSVQTVEPGTGKVVWENHVNESAVTDGVVTTDEEGKAAYSFTPPHGGIYKVYATSRDSLGNQITTSTFLWVTGENYVSWRQQNSNRINLKIDRDVYKVGDTAKILIASPFQGPTTALVTVERGKILQTKIVTLPSNSTIYDLPITEDMAPNAYVSVVVVKGVSVTNPSPSFRVGLIQLAVNPDHLNLNIKITPDKKQAGPREKVTYKLHVTNYMGEPVQAELGVALVDLANLSLMPDSVTPILQHFYGHKNLSVLTSSALTMSVDQQTEQILNTVKGGGGGGNDINGIMEVRQQFVDTPLWKPSVVTDNNGDATVDVILPDNLTTWRLTVRGVTLPLEPLKTTLVGQNTFDLISTKALLIRPITPRFYVVGDTSMLAAVVNNNTNQPQNVRVSADVSGALIQGDIQQTATIPANGRLRFDWPVVVQDVDKVGATFSVVSTDNKFRDAAKSAAGQGDDKTLPVLHYEAPDTIGTGGIIDKAGGDRTEGVMIPERLKAQAGLLSIRVENSLAASTASALKVLENYPYQCIEQTISRFLPNLMSYRAFKELKLDGDKTMRLQLEDTIRFAVQRLYNEQHNDGGWGWFVQEDSNSMVTAYALLGLIEAKREGFNVDPNVISRATNSLQQKLQELDNTPEAWKLNRQAFILYVLARENTSNVGRTVSLFSSRERMSIYARAYLAMTFDLIDPTDHYHVDPLISDIMKRAVVSATGVHWEETGNDYINMNTDVRSTAIVLMALVQTKPDDALIPNIVRWLMIARKSDAWETTQETAWSVMALTDWMKRTNDLKPNYRYNVQFNGTDIAKGQQVTPEIVGQYLEWQLPLSGLMTGQLNRISIDRTQGDGNLYYTSHLTVYMPIDQVKAETRGIKISRTYSLVTDREQRPITTARVGDNIRVTLTIIAPNDLNYVQITDPIPAGTEAVDPQLPQNHDIGALPNLSINNPLSQGWGWWWFSKTELRDDSVVLYASYLPRGTYQFVYTLRAGLVGQYHVIPATGHEFYFPEVYGRSDGVLFTLLPYVEPKLEKF